MDAVGERGLVMDMRGCTVGVEVGGGHRGFDLFIGSNGAGAGNNTLRACTRDTDEYILSPPPPVPWLTLTIDRPPALATTPALILVAVAAATAGVCGPGMVCDAEVEYGAEIVRVRCLACCLASTQMPSVVMVVIEVVNSLIAS